MQGFLWECNSPISRRCCWFLRYWTTTRSIGPEIIIPNASVVCFNRSQGLFQPYSATVKRFKRWSSIFCSDQCTTRVFSSKFSRSEANLFGLFVLNLGLDPVDQQKSRNDCLILFYKCSNLYTVPMFGSFFTIKYILRFQIRLNKVRFPSSRIDEPPDLFSKSEAPRGI